MIALIELLIQIILAATSPGISGGNLTTAEPIVSVVTEDGSFKMDGKWYCHELGACQDGGTPTVAHEWVGNVLTSEGWAMTAEELSSPIVLIEPVDCTTDKDCIDKNPDILEDPQTEVIGEVWQPNNWLCDEWHAESGTYGAGEDC